MAKEKKGNRSIAGEWFGNYYYTGAAQAFGFEAVFIESAGSVEGNILDEGQLGEAKVVGTFSYPAVSFTKMYRSGQMPVKYTGTLSEDGNSVSGNWHITPECRGTWTAWRNAEDEDEDTLNTEVEEEVEREKEASRPMVAPAKSR